MRYKFLLFDADNTVLDFDKSEERALKTALEKHGLQFNRDVLELYRKINVAEWQRLERGEITVDQVLVNRFVKTFDCLGISADIADISQVYERRLHFGYYVMPHAVEVLEKLQQTHKLYVVSNGVLSIQNQRMAGSHLDKYFLKRFISEEIGVPKPHKEFFERSFAQIENFDKSKALIIGDSLTSDIQGGINAGIDTCWYNYNGAQNTTGIQPKFEISDLRQLYKIVWYLK